MSESSIPAMAAPPAARDNPLTRSVAGLMGLGVLAALLVACLGSLPHTLGRAAGDLPPRYNDGSLTARHLRPSWIRIDPERHPSEAARREQVASERAVAALTADLLATAPPESLVDGRLPPGVPVLEPTPEQIAAHRPFFLFGTDGLGRDLLTRCLAGGGVSIGIGIAAATISVLIGTLYGAIAGYAGGRADAVMMRIVDVLYGLPYILLVVLLAVAGDTLIDEFVSRQGARASWMVGQTREALAADGLPSASRDARAFLDEHPEARTELEARMEEIPSLAPRTLSSGRRTTLEVAILLTAIGGVSWLTMARVIRGQVLSLKHQPFMEAARAAGVPLHRKFSRHLLPNLLGPIIVYATLIVPQAILQESFLSFLGIGVKPPLPSWGNLAANGLSELNTYEARWWLLVFPCLLLALTLLALNFVGEGLREAFDPKRSRR